MKRGIVIGVTGLDCSGKGEFVNILKNKGYHAISLSDIIRQEAKARGIEINRDNLISLGNQLRSEYGPGVLGFMAVALIKKNPSYSDMNWVIESIRNPSEVEALKQNFPDFHLVEVFADSRIRWKRMSSRKRDPDDPRSYSEMIAREKVQMSSDPSKQQFHKVIKLADFRIKNETSLKD